MIQMIKYDLKIGDMFSGHVTYEKEDYTTDRFVDIEYELYFKEGEITSIILTYYKWNDEGEKDLVAKFIKPDRFKSNFWKKLPKAATFDECCWKRKSVCFTPSENIQYDFISPNNIYHDTSCIV